MNARRVTEVVGRMLRIVMVGGVIPRDSRVNAPDVALQLYTAITW